MRLDRWVYREDHFFWKKLPIFFCVFGPELDFAGAFEALASEDFFSVVEPVDALGLDDTFGCLACLGLSSSISPSLVDAFLFPADGLGFGLGFGLDESSALSTSSVSSSTLTFFAFFFLGLVSSCSLSSSV